MMSHNSDTITDFRKLDKKHKFVVRDDEYGRILFISGILNKLLFTKGAVRFCNGKVFIVSTETIGKRKVSLFPWTEEWERRWQQQCNIDKIRDFLESANNEETFALSDLVAEESERPKFRHDPSLIIVIRLEIMKRVREDLSFVQIQRIVAMLYRGTRQIAA